MNDKLGSIFPVGFGATGGAYKGFTISMITMGGILDCIFFAALGACVGYGVKLLFDYLIKRNDLKKKRKNK